jgi:hypothetical protein
MRLTRSTTQLLLSEIWSIKVYTGRRKVKGRELHMQIHISSICSTSNKVKWLVVATVRLRSANDVTERWHERRCVQTLTTVNVAAEECSACLLG